MTILQYHPVPGARVTQRWGQNPPAYARFGLLGHNGIDFGVPEGTPVRAPAAGLVVESACDPAGFGEYVKVRADWGDWITAHLSKRMAAAGQTVAAGAVVGLSGNTGNSTGPHLHFGLRVNPNSRGDGWLGYEDPEPYLVQIAEPWGFPIGAHVIGKAGPYLGLLKRLQPRMVLFLDPDPTDLAAFRRVCSRTTVVARIYRPDSEIEGKIKADPYAAARWAHELVLGHPAREMGDFWQIANEVCQVHWPDWQALQLFEQERMRLASGHYRCALLGLSVGQPDLPATDRGAYWRAAGPTLAQAERDGHALVLHQYGSTPNIWGPEDRGGADWLLHRFEHQVRGRLGLFPWKRLPVFVTEFGYDGWIAEPGRQPAPGYKVAQTPAQYAQDLVDVAGYLGRFGGQVRGYAVFQLGDGGNWKNYDIGGEVLEALATAGEAWRAGPAPEPPPDPPAPVAGLGDLLWAQAEERVAIQLNPHAALQRQILADGFVPNSAEFRVQHGGQDYAAQRAESLGTGEVRVYFCPVGDWGAIRHQGAPEVAARSSRRPGPEAATPATAGFLTSTVVPSKKFQTEAADD